MSKVWFYDRQLRHDRNEEYLAVYAFFDATKWTEKGMYRWKILKRRDREEYEELINWWRRYHGLFVSNDTSELGSSSSPRDTKPHKDSKTVCIRKIPEPWDYQFGKHPVWSRLQQKEWEEQEYNDLSISDQRGTRHPKGQQIRRYSSTEEYEVSK
jgi:hypothetical protein